MEDSNKPKQDRRHYRKPVLEKHHKLTDVTEGNVIVVTGRPT